MSDQYFVSGYHITTNPDFQNEQYGNTPELRARFNDLFIEVQNKKNKKIITKLTDLILKNPLSPQLKNFLSVAYAIRGKTQKAYDVNNWIIAEHPDYLFGKLNRAKEFIDKNELEKVPSILGEGMEIKQLYPERKLFHLAEVTGYYKVVISYYVANNEIDLAENRLKVLKEIAPDHADTIEAQKNLFAAQMQRGYNRKIEEDKNRITPEKINKKTIKQTTDAPIFNHPEINYLYTNGLGISSEKLNEIIALPHATLVQDLEKMLTDAESRFNYFSCKRWDEQTHCFPLHAIFLLAEINAVESLPALFSFFENSYETIDYWLNDHKTETLWQCFYKLGFNNLEPLFHFLIKPSADIYIKTSVTEAMSQMVLHHPEKRGEVLAVLSMMLSKFNEANLEDNLIDSELLGLVICDVLDCNLKELIPVIKQLYQKGYVSISIPGTFEEVENDFLYPTFLNKKLEIYSIQELYSHVIKNWFGYSDEYYEDDEFDNDYSFIDSEKKFAPQLPIVRDDPKIGRNDPCPCGSGKKYKKCHGV